MTIHLVADVLDEQLVDSDGQQAGRIDGIVLVLRPDKPPLLAYVEVSPITLIARFNRRLARWYARLDARLGPGRGAPFRIPWTRLEKQERMFRMDLKLESAPINKLEDWLRETIVERIPGS